MCCVSRCFLGLSCLVIAARCNDEELIQLVRKQAEIIARLEKIMEADGKAESQHPCTLKVPFLGSGQYNVSGLNRLTLRNQTNSLPDVFLKANVTASAQNGLLVSLRVAVNDGNAYHFVCTFTHDQPHVATCSLTYEEPARPEGPAWLQVSFSQFEHSASSDQCIARHISTIGAFPYSHETSAAGVYAFDGYLKAVDAAKVVMV